MYTDLECWESCAHDEDREEEGTEWVNNKPIWFIDDNDRSDDYTNGLDNITYQMNNCSLNIDVGGIFVPSWPLGSLILLLNVAILHLLSCLVLVLGLDLQIAINLLDMNLRLRLGVR